MKAFFKKIIALSTLVNMTTPSPSMGQIKSDPGVEQQRLPQVRMPAADSYINPTIRQQIDDRGKENKEFDTIFGDW